MNERMQRTIGPCPVCGAACVWTATAGPYEFAWACAAGDHGVTSWDHAAAPPLVQRITEPKGSADDHL